MGASFVVRKRNGMGGERAAASDPWQVGKDGVPYTPETGAARALIDLKADSYLRVAAITGHPFSAWIVTTVRSR